MFCVVLFALLFHLLFFNHSSSLVLLFFVFLFGYLFSYVCLMLLKNHVSCFLVFFLFPFSLCVFYYYLLFPPSLVRVDKYASASIHQYASACIGKHASVCMSMCQPAPVSVCISIESLYTICICIILGDVQER